MKTFGLAAIAAVASFASFAGSASAQTLKVVSEADLFPPGHHRFVVHSDKVDRDFAVTVTMPVAFAIYGPPTTKVAAIYALDNGYDICGPLAQMLSRTGVISPAYVVSIGYVEGQPNMRAADYTFDFGGFGLDPGGPAFLQFLTTELRPLLEARYPLDPGKAVLFGHSYGGVFTVNALAENPKAFFGYIIGSASQISDTLVERLVRAAPKADGVRVFLAAGGAEGQYMIDFENRVAAALSVKGSAVKVETRVYAGESHTAYYPQMASAAFEWLLPPSTERKAVTLSAAQYVRLTGDYRTGDGRIINFSHSSNKTMIGIIGTPGYTELSAETERSFFVKGLDLPIVTFEGPDDKPATAMTVMLGGKPTRAVRVE
jgi:predicted alpha/beta superfamily hydrolase